MRRESTIWGIAGPVIRAGVDFPVSMYEVVHVGRQRLLGEVVRIQKGTVDIQVYENADGIAVGDPLFFSGNLLSVELAPGLLGSVFDGIGRPLKVLGKEGPFLERGRSIPTVDRSKLWHFIPLLKVGDRVESGDVVGTVEECEAVEHHIMAPPDFRSSKILSILEEGDYTVDTVLATCDGGDISMSQRWDVRRSRPVGKRLNLDRPLITGQRVLDTLFPLALGGAAVLPGGFGTGKTVTQQSIAKWCNADVIIYIGCGERGNEMTEVLEEFPELKDPYRDAPLMDRMILIANTSNMPVAAREASVYLGITMAEYYRDMGLNVAIMADSTSRWAEALREIGGRLEEMPGEEGYPAYLGTRLAEYYERSGRSVLLGSPEREGSITVINAVSPAGGDFSEPVTQASLRLSGVFWALDKALAQQRHFPSIQWNQSYSLYEQEMERFYREEVSDLWYELKAFLRGRLALERELRNLVQLVGRDGLSDKDKWILSFVDILKSVYLQQNAFDDVDASSSLKKQFFLLSNLKRLDDMVVGALSSGARLEAISDFPMVRDLLDLRGQDEVSMDRNFSSWISKLEEKLKASVVEVEDETL
ncbi:H+transporting two-sector ATPase alpha/beta subunit central region [Dethiosulfovibrio peptidovorans DSM 11002]|uniref:V-type ATP synthase alpha chain n=1 Tax=Dethiosulfovibrio peptidovorans DSM 11002 TaxID=469381 RepID=D2Z3Y0_9BACT|nr:V-type ATP synthase subunit A [Dethiosulfovibrio peptidovorans]EFC92241.1 H+transporting two-sector ATPase alpha/beta subunit central region [Dethiosulfovibrio peptidovorans DSM 11002]